MQLTQKNLKSLIESYKNLDLSDLDDLQLNTLNKVNQLSDPDKIILYLYSELQSFRKLAKALNVSFTTAYKSIKQIRKKLYDN